MQSNLEIDFLIHSKDPRKNKKLLEDFQKRGDIISHLTGIIIFPHVCLVSKDRIDLMVLLKTQTFSLLPPVRMLHTDQDSEL